MQFVHPQTHLPSTEYRRLQQLMLTMIGRRTALASVLRGKLGSALRARSSSVPRDVAVSGARVRFRVDGQHIEERILSWKPVGKGDAVHLSLLSPRGLALLGLAPGESIAYRTAADRTETLEVIEIAHRERGNTAPSVKSPLGDVTDVAPSLIPSSRNISGGQHA